MTSSAIRWSSWTKTHGVVTHPLGEENAQRILDDSIALDDARAMQQAALDE